MNREGLAARLRAMRSRAAIRGWERRQLAHARGSWDRLARCLALMRSAWAISDEDVATLLASGRVPEPAGLAFEPPRHLFVVTEGELAKLTSARRVVLQASTELLATPNLALVRFGSPSVGEPADD